MTHSFLMYLSTYLFIFFDFLHFRKAKCFWLRWYLNLSAFVLLEDDRLDSPSLLLFRSCMYYKQNVIIVQFYNSNKTLTVN